MSEQIVNPESPKPLKVWLPLLFSGVLVVGMLLGMRLKNEKPISAGVVEDTPYASVLGQGRIEEVIRYVEAKYVDKVDKDELVEKAISHMLHELDPHSNYISAKELDDVNERLDGNFEGIGVEFMILEDTITVISPLSGGPSEDVGVMSGDKIVTISDSLVAGIHIDVAGVTHRLKGAKGSKVKVGIRRGNEKTLRSFVITRDEIPIHSVDCAYMLNPQTGYIKINGFSATTYKEFMEALEKLVSKNGMKDLVIDVRQNPGGYLQEATNVLSQLFKEKDKLLVYTEGRTVHRADYESTGRAYYPIGKIAVLIDEGSASASEILSGAIQDWDRGVLVGRRTFGKGLVQEQYPLRDGGALRLTVARYYTPSGRCIQRPYSDDYDAYEKDIYERYVNGELSNADSTFAIKDTTKYYTSGGRVVYGGGGITPDYFVPIDKIFTNEYYIALRQYLPEFVYRYFITHRKDLPKSLPEFRKQYKVTDDFYNEFISYADAKGAKKDNKQIPVVKEPIKLLLKARLGKQLFDDEGFYSVYNESDQAVIKAEQLLKLPNPLETKKIVKK